MRARGNRRGHLASWVAPEPARSGGQPVVVRQWGPVAQLEWARGAGLDHNRRAAGRVVAHWTAAPAALPTPAALPAPEEPQPRRPGSSQPQQLRRSHHGGNSTAGRSVAAAGRASTTGSGEMPAAAPGRSTTGEPADGCSSTLAVGGVAHIARRTRQRIRQLDCRRLRQPAARRTRALLRLRRRSSTEPPPRHPTRQVASTAATPPRATALAHPPQSSAGPAARQSTRQVASTAATPPHATALEVHHRTRRDPAPRRAEATGGVGRWAFTAGFGGTSPPPTENFGGWGVGGAGGSGEMVAGVAAACVSRVWFWGCCQWAWGWP